MQDSQSTISIIKPDNSIICSSASLNMTGEQLLAKIQGEGQINPYLYDIKIKTGNQLKPLDMTSSLKEQQFQFQDSSLLFQCKTAQDNQNFGQLQANNNKNVPNNQQFSPMKFSPGMFNPGNNQVVNPGMNPMNAGMSPVNPGVFTGMNPGNNLGMNQGVFTGINQGAFPGVNPGINYGAYPVMKPGVNPFGGSILENPNALKKKLQEKESDIEEKDKQIDSLKEEIEKLQKIIKQLKGEKDNEMNQVDSQQKLMDQDHEDEIRKLKTHVQKEKAKNTQLNSQIESLNQEKEEVESKLSKKEAALSKLKKEIGRQTLQQSANPLILNSLTNQDDEYLTKLRQKNNELMKENNQLKLKLSQLEEGQGQKQEILQQVNQKDAQVRFQTEQMDTLVKQMKLLESKVKELEHQVFVDKKVREDRDKQIDKLKYEVNQQKSTLELKDLEIEQNHKLVDFFRNQLDSIPRGSTIVVFQQECQNKLQDMQVQFDEQRAAKERQEQLKLQQQQEEFIKAYQDKMQAVQANQALVQQEKKKKAVKLREAIMNNQGVLQVGLLVDVTGSMDQYKDATMKMIDSVMKCIKQQTNRDCEWGSVCYQDFAELKQRGEYYQHSFARDQRQVMEFLNKIKCDGGDDGAEDLRGGIKQLVKNLRWEKYFKIALLICDAPSHGKKWAGKTLDDHPDEDLTDALQQLIDKNILLIGIEFDSRTDEMFRQMKSYYASQNKSQSLITVAIKTQKPEEIQRELIKIISEASVQVTEVNQTGTKTKVQQQQQVNKEGALEALVKKLPDPSKFNQAPGIELMDTKFEVYRVEIKQQAFEQKFTQISNFKVPDDYQIVKESEWNCVRTKKPFAFGQLKAVYLMKKKEAINGDELYVIKMPIGDKTYASINEAVQECRSHLICQKLMQKFITDLQNSPHKKNMVIPQLRYSDFLILKEHNTSFWIAERFFQGDFVKYNNNFGYINDDNSEINLLAQSFAYYTYVISDFDYIVNDIQGVGMNFTDPAINTNKGNFDETDMGQEGLGQYIVSFEARKDKYNKYMSLIDLNQY